MSRTARREASDPSAPANGAWWAISTRSGDRRTYEPAMAMFWLPDIERARAGIYPRCHHGRDTQVPADRHSWRDSERLPLWRDELWRWRGKRAHRTLAHARRKSDHPVR